MKTETCKISVIIPCYNQAQFLNECLNSVLEQTYQNWECIIINDGSLDYTEEVAKKWIDKDSRFRYLKQENRGVSAARNLGIENATGEWILPLDSDDSILPEYMTLAETRFNDDFKIITCRIKRFGLYNDVWNLPEFTLENLAQGNMIVNCSFFRKRDWSLIGGYDEALIYGYEDWDLWISILKNGGKVLKMDYIGLNYRIKEESRTTELWKEDRLERTLKHIEKKHFDFFAKHFKSLHFYYGQYHWQKRILEKNNKRTFVKILNKFYDIFS